MSHTLRVVDVAKAFGATRAVRAASLDLLPGEVHCIVGENGSGKSTLVKILSGIHRPDSGRLEIFDQSFASLPTPRAALAAGISTVFQEVLVVEPRSVLENVWLGVDGMFRTRVSAREKRRRAEEVLEQLLGDSLPLDLPVEALSLSERQACSIARALVRDPKVLVLDEATSALDVQTRDRLFDIVRRQGEQGTSTIFISHRMDEISEIGDRCTVMRSGETVATLDRGDATAAELVRLMTGADHLAPVGARDATERAVSGGVVLRAEGLALGPGRTPIDFELRAGELVGLAGLEGHGQDEFIKALWGMGGEGTVVGSAGVPIVSPRQAASLGISYVPRERRAEAMFESKSVRENFGLPTLGRDVRAGVLRPSQTRARLNEWVSRLNIKLGSPEHLITTLSGGNQQKVVMARWLAADPQVLLLNDPTRGVDVGAKRDIYGLLGELAQQGVAIVMLSTELDEHIELVDRVLVFREQELFCELSRAETDRRSLVAAYFGRRERSEPEPAHA
ncbi:MAG: sugar ABC transporter ATP-binding protein [Actinomycetota bacterium]|nr:sugar ABC transporter ATP-binding protein [Actinomycetota bacterium]